MSFKFNCGIFMKFIRKHIRYIIYVALFAVIILLVLPWAKGGYSTSDQAILDSYGTRTVLILLALGWAALILSFAVKDGFKGIGYKLLSTALFVLPFFFVFRPFVTTGLYLMNTTFADRKENRTFLVSSLFKDGSELYLRSANSIGPATVLRYPAKNRYAEGDTIVLMEHTGFLGMRRYTD
ncbi:MAG: hypothetical protein EOO45_17030 [Flavobacterium sp.]|nr:MAG: hypothetical protein EOO45_17030 [Flavobacterium sp.]